MANFIIVCPDCNCGFPNYEKYNQHIFEKHGDKPSLRMKAKIMKCDQNQDIHAGCTSMIRSNAITIINAEDNGAAILK